MKPTRPIIHRFLTLTLASLLLLLHGGGTHFVRSGEKAASAVASKARKAAGKTTENQSVIVKSATDEAVVAPALSFDFSQVTYLLPVPQLRLLLLNQPLLRRVNEVPYFYFSYLRYVFGHFIAPNAP
jgi:hypothetical protein